MYPICASIFEKDVEVTDFGESYIEQSVSSLGTYPMGEFDEFETHELTIDELVETLHVLGSGDWTGVILDPAYKYVEVDQVYTDMTTLRLAQYAIA